MTTWQLSPDSITVGNRPPVAIDTGVDHPLEPLWKLRVDQDRTQGLELGVRAPSSQPQRASCRRSTPHRSPLHPEL